MCVGSTWHGTVPTCTRSRTASFYPCTVNGSCHGPEPWGVSWITAMFLHGSWGHILGKMLFLAIFGKNVEDAFGRLALVGGFLFGLIVAKLLTNSGRVSTDLTRGAIRAPA
jgi:membrane associated rhomboid family serine protease